MNHTDIVDISNIKTLDKLLKNYVDKKTIDLLTIRILLKKKKNYYQNLI